MVTKADPRFADLLDKLFGDFNSQCLGAKGDVNIFYAKRYMRPRATVLAWIQSGVSSCGFGLGFIKWVPELQKSVFYVDLVCSQHRKGADVLRALEGHAKMNGADVVALRAAVPALVAVYESKKYQYKRLANACLPPSRAGRLALRTLDRFAGSPGGRHGLGIYTDGVFVVSSAADAWRAVKLKRPKNNALLPPGWTFEEGFHGWWMSKCL